MNWQAISFDWNQARAFLATAQEGSLSAAAKALGQTQPTLSRQVAALEQDLGVTLFERIGRALTLTQAGRELLDHFRDMGDAARRISLAASGQSQKAEGRVRLTSTDTVATFHLPAMLKRLRRDAPGIEIELIASNDTRDLMRREADIAIRHGRPDQPDLIAKLVGGTEVHFYASTDYLDRIGRPSTMEALSAADFIGFDTVDYSLGMYRQLGLNLTRDNVRLATASGTAYIELTRQGLGISAITEGDARRFPELERVLPDLGPALPVPVWLVTHREIYTSRRIRIVFDLLADELKALSESNYGHAALAPPVGRTTTGRKPAAQKL